MKFYLAGPFFNEEQRGVLEKIERCAGELGMVMYSPRLESLCPPNAPEEMRIATFRSNHVNLRRNQFVLARIDDFDPGTVWEIGYSYAVGTPVYAFTTVEGRGLNLMLAQSCKGFLVGLESVYTFLKTMEESKGMDDTEATKWKKPII